MAIIAKFALKSKPDTKFVVSTTHLLFNPKRHDIRLAQIQVLLAELDRIARDEHQHNQTIPIILTGDFNIQQNSEVFRLIIGESIKPETLFGKMNFRFGSNFKNLLPREMGISDNCQHLDVVVNSNRYQTTVRIDFISFQFSIYRAFMFIYKLLSFFQIFFSYIRVFSKQIVKVKQYKSV